MSENSADQHPLSLEGRADSREVDPGYTQRLIKLGAVPEDEVGTLYGTPEEAALAPEAVLSAVEHWKLSLSFLDTPAWTFAGRPDLTHQEIAGPRLKW
jgi:hypothetical protein